MATPTETTPTVPTIDGQWAFTTIEYARRTNQHPESVRRAIREGRLQAVRTGKRQFRIPASAVKAALGIAS